MTLNDFEWPFVAKFYRKHVRRRPCPAVQPSDDRRARQTLSSRYCSTFITIQQTTPWFDADCRAARRRTRAAERRYRRTRCDRDKCAWSDEVRKLSALYEEKNNNYWRNEIAARDGDMTRLWRLFHGVLGDVSSDDTDTFSADDFATFFSDKVDSVRASTAATPLYDVPYRTTPTLDEWTAVQDRRDWETDELCTVQDVSWTRLQHGWWRTYEVCCRLSSRFCSTSNMETGCFSSEFKKALVRPLLKKRGLDANQYIYLLYFTYMHLRPACLPFRKLIAYITFSDTINSKKCSLWTLSFSRYKGLCSYLLGFTVEGTWK